MSLGHPATGAPRVSLRLQAFALGLLTSLLWASTFLIVKMALVDMGPISIGAFRYLFAFFILLPLLLRQGPARIRQVPRQLWVQLVLAGVLGYPLSASLLYWGLTAVPPTTSSFINNLSPFVVVAIGFFVLREAPALLQWLGFAVVIAGIAAFFSIPLGQGETWGVVATPVVGDHFCPVQRAVARLAGEIHF